jgi:3-hydroxypropanoate dehydrogenase
MSTADSALNAAPIGSYALDRIFLEARTHSGWLDLAVSEEDLNRIYDLLKWGPTSANCSPARIVFVRSPEAKSKLLACLDPGNREKTAAAPVTAILAYDLKFYDKIPALYPHGDARAWFAGNTEFSASTAFRNGTLQGAYFIVASRALGFDCGPMSGFDNAKVDAAFFAGNSWRSNFLCNLGHGNPGKVRPRDPRLAFDEACRIE